MLKLEHLKEVIISMYNEKPNIEAIAKELGEYPQAVSNVLKKYTGLTNLRPSPGNTSYFDNIDSHSKAYIVGFIAADGSLVERNNACSLTITLKYTDKVVLDFIKDELGCEHKISTITRKHPTCPDKDDILLCRLAISHPQITQSLIKLGIVPRKTLILGNIIQNIPLEFRDSFIIGYFDGDGSVSLMNSIKRKYNKTEGIFKEYPCHNVTIQIRGTSDFLKGVCNHLCIKESFVRKYDSIPCLSFANKKDILRFFNCYRNLDFFLERKHNVFLQRINHPSYDKYK